MRGDRHGWNHLEHYIGIHDSCLSTFDHFIEENTISFTVTGPDSILVEGWLACAGGVYLDVRKILDLNARNQVRTFRYSYHVGIKRAEDRAIFRYDNAHRYEREHHPDEHHKHVFDASGKEAGPPLWIGRDSCPTLEEVLAELEEWWSETGWFLAESDQ